MLRSLAAVLVMGPVLMAANGAGAQMSATVLSIGTRDSQELGLALNANECADNVEMELRISGIPTSRSVLDFWRGTGTTDCSTEAARNPDTATCTNLNLTDDNSISGQAEITLTIPIQELMGCDLGDGGYRVYVLAANGPASTEALDGSEVAFVDLDLDTTSPKAPSNLEGGRGNTQVSLNWDNESGGNESFQIKVYVDTTGDSSATEPADCPSSTLVAGAAVPEGLSSESTWSGSSTSGELNPESLGLEVGQAAAVALATLDLAGNRSVLSSVVCVTRIETFDYCDSNPCEEGFQCSVIPMTPNRGGDLPWKGSPWKDLWPIGAGLLWIGPLRSIRRRRSR